MTDDMEVPVSVPALRMIALNIPCDRCKAGVGDACRKPSGESLWKDGLPTRVHVQRVAPVWVIYKIGYRHGRRDMKKEINSGTHVRQGAPALDQDL